MQNIFRGLWVILFGILPAILLANTSMSRISLEYGEDDLGGSSYLIDVNHVLHNDVRVIVGYGENTHHTLSSNYTTSLYYLGLGSDPAEDFSLKGIFEESGKKNELMIQSISVPLTFKTKLMTLTITPVARSIDIYTLTNRVVNVDSNAFGIQLTLYPGEHARLMGSYFNYDYSRRVSLLTAFKFIPYFSNPTLQLASGFLDESLIAEVGMDYERFSWTFGWNRSVSALDATISEYSYLSLDYVLSSNWSVYATSGQYQQSIAGNDNFITVGLNYAY